MQGVSWEGAIPSFFLGAFAVRTLGVVYKIIQWLNMSQAKPP